MEAPERSRALCVQLMLGMGCAWTHGSRMAVKSKSVLYRRPASWGSCHDQHVGNSQVSTSQVTRT